jgi:hypothetical protein
MKSEGIGIYEGIGGAINRDDIRPDGIGGAASQEGIGVA